MSARHRHKRRGDQAARHERVRKVADVLKLYDASPFQYEAACRQAIRAKLCLDGWEWHDADREAHKLVQAALDLIGAKRPPTYMAQPEYTQEGVRAGEPTHCRRCRKVLPDDGTQRRYCSVSCRDADRVDRESRDEKKAKLARQRAWAAAWRAKQPERRCAHCGGKFKPSNPSKPDQQYCSQRCSGFAAVRRRRERRGASV
jgi:predicted nucleic acid-binding Zn ribbon protein